MGKVEPSKRPDRDRFMTRGVMNVHVPQAHFSPAQVAGFGEEASGAAVNAEERLRAGETRLVSGSQGWIISSPFRSMGLLVSNVTPAPCSSPPRARPGAPTPSPGRPIRSPPSARRRRPKDSRTRSGNGVPMRRFQALPGPPNPRFSRGKCHPACLVAPDVAGSRPVGHPTETPEKSGESRCRVVAPRSCDGVRHVEPPGRRSAADT
jgi:hypothetical protein